MEQQVSRNIPLCTEKYDSASLQMIMQEQDKTLDAISGTLSTLQQQAGLMGTEITEHVE